MPIEIFLLIGVLIVLSVIIFTASREMPWVNRILIYILWVVLLASIVYGFICNSRLIC